MVVTPILTERITIDGISLINVLNTYLENIVDGSILALSSKIISICEGRTIPTNQTTKEALMHQEASYYLPASLSKFGYRFTITQNSLIGVAGIDKSNGNGNYILWPKNPQLTANWICHYLKERFNIKNVGIIIVDSTSTPFGVEQVALF